MSTKDIRVKKGIPNKRLKVTAKVQVTFKTMKVVMTLQELMWLREALKVSVSLPLTTSTKSSHFDTTIRGVKFIFIGSTLQVNRRGEIVNVSLSELEEIFS